MLAGVVLVFAAGKRHTSHLQKGSDADELSGVGTCLPKTVFSSGSTSHRTKMTNRR